MSNSELGFYTINAGDLLIKCKFIPSIGKWDANICITILAGRELPAVDPYVLGWVGEKEKKQTFVSLFSCVQAREVCRKKKNSFF